MNKAKVIPVILVVIVLITGGLYVYLPVRMIIVGVSIIPPFQTVSDPSSLKAVNQTSAITKSVDEVLNSLYKGSYMNLKRFKYIPFFAVTVSQYSYNQLLRHPLVTSVNEDSTGFATTGDVPTEKVVPETPNIIHTREIQVQWGIPIVYTNTQYGFKFVLPESWKGYSIVNSAWGSDMDKKIFGGGKIGTNGPSITFRNPHWTKAKPYQDIPIEIFTLEQWNGLGVTYEPPWAGGIVTELGRNSKYIFIINSRSFNAVDTVAGMDEVNKIMESHPLDAF